MGFNIYKRGQGKYTRLCTAFGGALIAGGGCWRLYQMLGAWLTALSRNTAMWVEIMVPVGLFVVLALFLLWLVNKPSVADFMIAAEGEMKKVSWSSRQEIIVSTTVVIVVVILMALVLFVTDMTFRTFFTWILEG
ncbi:MAG TPA: preprotein translocase subunit SecE [Sedimentisphaerales bacterium]|nr:preprotein translocase subunit SecE [Sedimentisphaerales bacterium]